MGNTFVKTVQENSTEDEQSITFEKVHVTQEQIPLTEESVATEEIPVVKESVSTEETPVVEESVATEEISVVEEKDETNNSKLGITLLFICSITEGNPGANTVMHQLMSAGYEPEFINEFCKKIIEYKITGSRLWYLYKNECFYDINELVSKDLTPFTDSYYEKIKTFN